jgi:hypothetical protein
VLPVAMLGSRVCVIERERSHLLGERHDAPDLLHALDFGGSMFGVVGTR